MWLRERLWLRRGPELRLQHGMQYRLLPSASSAVLPSALPSWLRLRQQYGLRLRGPDLRRSFSDLRCCSELWLQQRVR